MLRRFVDLSSPLEHQDAHLAGGWDLGVWTPPILRIYLSLGRLVAVVVTVAGFVVRGFDLRGTRLDLGRGHLWRLVQKRFRP